MCLTALMTLGAGIIEMTFRTTSQVIRDVIYVGGDLDCNVREVSDGVFNTKYLSGYQYKDELYQCIQDAVEEMASQPYEGRVTNAAIMGRVMELLQKDYGHNAPKGWYPVMKTLRGQQISTSALPTKAAVPAAALPHAAPAAALPQTATPPSTAPATAPEPERKFDFELYEGYIQGLIPEQGQMSYSQLQAGIIEILDKLPSDSDQRTFNPDAFETALSFLKNLNEITEVNSNLFSIHPKELEDRANCRRAREMFATGASIQMVAEAIGFTEKRVKWLKKQWDKENGILDP
jgi:predicted house-cleaning noncanonical NTP pyrophosphatase (MazG superfamily)